MASVKALCVRLINRKTYEKETITNMVNTYHAKGMLTDEELADLILLIDETYKE